MALSDAIRLLNFIKKKNKINNNKIKLLWQSHF